MRPTEIAGAFGIHQINRLDEYVRIRRANPPIGVRILRP